MSRVKRFGMLVVVILAGWLIWPTAGVPILAYHQVGEADDIYSVTADQFEYQMEYLSKNGYTAISLKELFDFYDGKSNLPEKPIVITFDDGYEDNYLTALPIMEKYKMRSTVFVVPSLVGTTEYLSWQQISEMRERQTEIGSHSMSHVAMNEISTVEQYREIGESRTVLEEHLGQPVLFFAYPYGQFTGITEQILWESGYRGACSGITGLNSKGVDAYALKRLNVPHPRMGLWEFRLRLLRANLYSKLGI